MHEKKRILILKHFTKLYTTRLECFVPASRSKDQSKNCPFLTWKQMASCRCGLVRKFDFPWAIYDLNHRNPFPFHVAWTALVHNLQAFFLSKKRRFSSISLNRKRGGGVARIISLTSVKLEFIISLPKLCCLEVGAVSGGRSVWLGSYVPFDWTH